MAGSTQDTTTDQGTQGTGDQGATDQGTQGTQTEKVVPLATFKAAESEAKSLKQRLAAFEAAEEQRRQETLTEQQRAEERAKTAEAERDALRLAVRVEGRKSVILGAAQKAGFANAEDALAFVDAAIDGDDEDAVREALKEQVGQVLEDRPYLRAGEREPERPGRVGATPPQSNGDKSTTEGDANRAWRRIMNRIDL